MINLLKYDWKRNANTYLGVAVVLVILEALIAYFGIRQDWGTQAILPLSIMLYAFAGIFLIVLGCKTFEHNLKAYHRRLLPLHPVWAVFSAVLISWISILLLLALMFVHGIVLNYTPITGVSELLEGVSAKEMFYVFLSGIWIYTLLMITILLAITVGAMVSIRGKAGTWVAILFFFVIQNVIGFIESRLFGGDVGNFYNLGILRVETGPSGTSSEITAAELTGFNWGTIVFELAVVALMVWAITYMINRRMEI